MKRSKLLFVTGVLLTMLQFAGVSSAQLLVQEGKIKKVVRPGLTVADKITLHNSTDKSIGVTVYLEDFEYVEPYDGSKKFFPASTVKRSASTWISFEPKEFTIPAYAKKMINYSINVPEDVSGGYYSVMFFERTDRQNITDGQVGIQIVSRVGSLFFLETSDRVKKIDLQSLEMKGNSLTADLKNDGNVNLVVRCFYYVLNNKNIPVDRGETETFYIEPDGQKHISIEMNERLGSGLYTAILTFDLEDGISSVHEIDFNVGKSGEYQLTAHRR